MDEDNCEINEEEDVDEVEVGNQLPVGHYKIRPSSFRGLPPTIYVDYPPELNVSRADTGHIIPLPRSCVLHYKCHWERICIRNAFNRAGFTKSDASWTALWSKHLSDSQMKDLNCLQKINHFPGSWCVGRKDRLLGTINALKRLHGSEFDFHPEGFILPNDRDLLHRVLDSQNVTTGKKPVKENLWIMKPVASSQGKGIRVVNSGQVMELLTSKSKKNKSAIIQRYIHSPYLIDGKKFDLRIYCLVTGVDPLRVYMHEEGLTRISTAEYSLKNTKNRFAHLTNYSINKKSAAFVAASMEDNEGGDNSGETEGFKWSLSAFKRWLSKQESVEKMEETFKKIQDLVVKTMVAAESEITPRMHNAANYRTNCFELFGLDIILDKNLEPYLLEVNISPSLMGSSPLDKKIKGILIADILHVVGLYPHDTTWLSRFESMEKGNGRAGVVTSDKDLRSRSLSRRGTSEEREQNAMMDKDSKSSKRSSSLSGSGKKVDGGKKAEQTSVVAPSNFSLNPFSFNSLSMLLNNQDCWRKNPIPENVDFTPFISNRIQSARGRNGKSDSSRGATDSVWVILLMIEDEFARARCSKFNLLHPTPEKVEHYLGLYRNSRFSDHLLAKWILNNGIRGKFADYPPRKFLYGKADERIAEAGKSGKVSVSPLKSRISGSTPRSPEKLVSSVEAIMSARSSNAPDGKEQVIVQKKETPSLVGLIKPAKPTTAEGGISARLWEQASDDSADLEESFKNIAISRKVKNNGNPLSARGKPSPPVVDKPVRRPLSASSTAASSRKSLTPAPAALVNEYRHQYDHRNYPTEALSTATEKNKLTMAESGCSVNSALKRKLSSFGPMPSRFVAAAGTVLGSTNGFNAERKLLSSEGKASQTNTDVMNMAIIGNVPYVSDKIKSNKSGVAGIRYREW